MGIELKSVTRIDRNKIKRVLRIVAILLIAIIFSFILLFYGIFSAESYLVAIICITLALYILLPVTFCCCPVFQQYMVFQSHVEASGIDFNNPDGIKGVRNLILTTPNGIKIGLWHILPSIHLEESEGKGKSFWEESAKSENHKGIIIYFHGVTGTRGKPHRKELYKVLQNNEHHIISCDYRNFGDSTKVRRVTESGVVDDAANVYRWVRNDLLGGENEIPIFVWGHSLGTGISTHLVRKLCGEVNMIPSGLVLESPFDNFAEELRHHRKLKIWSRLPVPFFDFLFVKPLIKNDIAFLNDGHICKIINVPILILHSKDDNIIPSVLGKRLFDVGKKNRPTEASPMYFVHLNAGKHNEMYKDNHLVFRKVFSSFFKGCLSRDHTWHKDEDMSAHQVEIHSTHL